MNGFLAAFHADDRAMSIVETALLVPVLLLLTVTAIDLGRAYYVALEVTSAAEAGALYGTQNPSDTSGMQTAAQHYAADVPQLSAIATRGCECSDGGSATVSCSSLPSCTYNVLNYVDVTTTAVYTLTLHYPGLPSSITLKGKSRMRSAQ